MKYEGIIIRPPSEADSLILQVTTGCSHNRCTFCPTYKGQGFRIKTLSEIEEDMQEAGNGRSIRRVFLCDGDALIIPQPRLLEILASVRRHSPDLERIGTYANAKSILRKSTDELAALRDMGLRMIYMGIETGNDELLRTIVKGTTSAKLIEAGKRIRKAGLTLSVTILLGIGGIERSIQHAMDTAEILTKIDPDFVGALTLMLVPGTPLYEDYIHGRFVLPDTFGFLRELLLIMRNASFTDCLFTSNHASNYLPIRVRLPSEKLKAIQTIESVLSQQDGTMLRPEAYRAL
ncbi:MAG: radical SAM protein [Deltaproteobacteria bacterium]|nr:radical SAM protein [Deltaproteobacteria bacterium]